MPAKRTRTSPRKSGTTRRKQPQGSRRTTQPKSTTRRAKTTPRRKPATQRTTKTTTRRKPARVAPVPRGYHTVTPTLTVRNAAEAIAFYERAFGAKERRREVLPDGRIMHAEVKIGDSIVMLSDEFPGAPTRDPAKLGGSAQSLNIYTRNVDKMWDQAVRAGAEVVMPIENQFWGDRFGVVRDPFGQVWSLAMRVNMTKKEKAEKQRAAEAMLLTGGHLSPEPRREERELFA